MRKLILFLAFIVSFYSFSQELNCTVVVYAQFTGDENLQQFKTLEDQLNEFVKNTRWTNKTFGVQERIECNMVITISEYSNDLYKATLQIQSARPVYGSSYSTPIYNINDQDFNFQYIQFQNLIYNPNQFESNLISVLAFHIYMVLGLDADTFELNGGQQYFEQAQNIANYSQAEGFKGWKLEDGLQTRFVLINNLLSPTFENYRKILYQYHREGLDVMSQDAARGKKAIADAIGLFAAIHKTRPNSFLVRTFFDAKSDEIGQIFSDGPNVNVSNMVDLLNKVAPNQSSVWRNIKF